MTYDGALPATFGNAAVTAICTGTVTGDTLVCTEMLTKCPSKYESAEGALTVETLLANSSAYIGTEVSLAGYVTEGVAGRHRRRRPLQRELAGRLHRRRL